MNRIGGMGYEVRDGVVLRRSPSGAVEALGVRGRPDFSSDAAMSGVLYRAAWLPDGGGAARFRDVEAVRDGGNCLHVACRDGARRQWWCYRPREHDDGTLSLLAEWAPSPERPRRRRLGIAPSRSM
jgi:hypothetical protein